MRGIEDWENLLGQYEERKLDDCDNLMSLSSNQNVNLSNNNLESEIGWENEDLIRNLANQIEYSCSSCAHGE